MSGRPRPQAVTIGVVLERCIVKPKPQESQQGTGNREQGTRNREQGTGNREQGAGNREQGTGNREQGTGNREHYRASLGSRTCSLFLVRCSYSSWFPVPTPGGTGRRS